MNIVGALAGRLADAIAAPGRRRATHDDVQTLRAELAAERERSAALARELEEARRLPAEDPAMGEIFGGDFKLTPILERPAVAMALIDRIFSRMTGAEILASGRAYHRSAPGCA